MTPETKRMNEVVARSLGLIPDAELAEMEQSASVWGCHPETKRLLREIRVLRVALGVSHGPTSSICPVNADGKHRDAGGMFTFSCRDCGWVEDETYGADASCDPPRLGR